MAEEKVVKKPEDYGNEYGYGEEEQGSPSPFVFGLNAGVTFMTKFEWINNAGKGGAEGEALDVVFNINGKDKNYRIFPVTQAFGANNEVITDRTHEKFKETVRATNAIVSHILGTFLTSEQIQIGFGRAMPTFKDYVQAAMAMLPVDYKSRKLDIFMQYQWEPSTGKDRTYLDIPKKMTSGKWLCAAMPGTWVEKRPMEEKVIDGVPTQVVIPPTDAQTEALWYVNEKNEKHLFIRNGWFMASNFAKQLKPAATPQRQRPPAQGGTNTGTPPSGTPPAAKAGNASAW